MEARNRTKVFVSYEDAEARSYALCAKRVFQEKGIIAWVWERDRKHAGYVMDEIMDAIERSHYFVYIATKSSNESRGQDFERRYAWDQGRDPAFVLTFSEGYLWRGHRIGIWNFVSDATFEQVCGKIAKELLRYQRVERGATVIREGQDL